MECTNFINSNIFVRDLGVRYSKSSSRETNYWKRAIAEVSEPLDDEGSTGSGCILLSVSAVNLASSSSLADIGTGVEVNGVSVDSTSPPLWGSPRALAYLPRGRCGGWGARRPNRDGEWGGRDGE